MTEYLLIAGVVLTVNLLPAFGPPTWAVLVLFKLNSHVLAVPLVLVGATSAMAGRLLLARLSRRFLRRRLAEPRRRNLQVARDLFAGSRAKALGALGLFALSPVPSAQLFIAAGLLDVALLPLTAAFFAGRLASYSIYVSVAGLADHHFGALLRSSLTSPVGVSLQVLMVVALVALVRLDWSTAIRWADAHRGWRRGPAHDRQAGPTSPQHDTNVSLPRRSPPPAIPGPRS